MQLGIFAKTFSATGAMNSLLAAKSTGYNAVQFNMSCVGLSSLPDEIPHQITREIAAAVKASGIELAAVSATYNMIHPDVTQRKAGLRKLGVMIAAAKTMGTGLVTLCTGTRDPLDQWRHHPDNQSTEAWRDLLAEMEAAVQLAETHGIDLGIEPELANVVNNVAAARRLIDEIKSPRIRIVLDPANLFEVETENQRHNIISQSVDLLGDRISMAHAKDRDAAGNFVAAGYGVIDFPHFIAELRRANFNGPLVTHGLGESEAPAVAAFLKKAMAA
jgi:sugar phosphate isomerase/epimerase